MQYRTCIIFLALLSFSLPLSVAHAGPKRNQSEMHEGYEYLEEGDRKRTQAKEEFKEILDADAASRSFLTHIPHALLAMIQAFTGERPRDPDAAALIGAVTNESPTRLDSLIRTITPRPHGLAVSPMSGSVYTVLSNGTVKMWDNHGPGRILPNLSRVVQVSAGVCLSCALMADGKVDCWPEETGMEVRLQNLTCGNAIWEENGALRTRSTFIDYSESVPTDLPPVEKISVGTNSVCAILKERGQTQCWGGLETSYQELISTLENVAQVETFDADHMTCVRMANGLAECFHFIYGRFTLTEDAVHIFGNNDEICAILGNGSIRCRSENNNDFKVDYSPLDLSADEKALQTKMAPQLDHSCALIKNQITHESTIRCWEDIDEEPRLLRFPGLSPAIEFHITDNNELITLHEDGAIRSWSFSPNSTVPFPSELRARSLWDETPPLEKAAVQISSGEDHTCARLRDGSIQCWGSNGWDQSTPPSNIPPALSMTGGDYSTCAVILDGTVHCWGQLGSEGEQNQLIWNPQDYDLPPAQQLFVNYRRTYYNFSRNNKWSESYSTFRVLLSDGTLWDLIKEFDGNNQDYYLDAMQSPFSNVIEIGLSIMNPLILSLDESTAGSTPCTRQGDGSVSCLDTEGNLSIVQNNVIQLSNTGCMVLMDGSIRCLGKESVPLKDLPPARQVEINGRRGCVLLQDGTVRCWGEQNTPPAGLRDVIQLSLEKENSCALHQNGTVTCWGSRDVRDRNGSILR